MFSLQAFLLPTPHQCELQMDEGPALQHRRLSALLQSSVFPEFVSSPSLHLSCSSATSCQGTVRAGSQELSLPQCPHSPQSPAQQAEPGASNKIHLQSLTHGVREQLQGRREGEDRDKTAAAQLLSPSRAGMCIQGDGEETRAPQGRGRGTLNGIWAGVWGELRLL